MRAYINALQNWLSQYAYCPAWFVLRSTCQSVSSHHVMGLSAALSFYALFALIPLIVLIFFLLSHIVYSSDYAIVRLAILTSNLLPEFSQRIMLEVYNNTQTKAAWGFIGFFILLWAIIPLATHMRISFYLIASRQDVPSFWLKKGRDIMIVLAVLLVFFLFTAAGFILESIILFLAKHFPTDLINLVGWLSSLALTTLLIAGFYRTFCPLELRWKHILIAALFTAGTWLFMRPAFGLFLSVNKNFGAIFGSMKAMFVSISWLYMNFAIFLIGIELMVTLKQQNVLLLKGLFDDRLHQENYLAALIQKFGRTYSKNEYVFRQGNKNHHYYMVATGTVRLIKEYLDTTQNTVRILQTGDFFGETALFSSQRASASALVVSNDTILIEINTEDIETLLQQDPQLAVRLLKQLSDPTHPVKVISQT